MRSQYVCQQCGYSQTGWAGKCPECGTWGSLVETVVSSPENTSKNANAQNTKPKSLREIKSTRLTRISTKISELDRALGGGIVPGQVILIAGEPGIGKSTILLQVADNLGKVVYVSGEESIQQIKLRAERLGIRNKNIEVLETTSVDNIVDLKADIEKENLKLLIVDSIQTMSTSDLSGLAGSVGQVRESAFRLVRLAKSTGTPIIIVGHVTKEGSVAGPAVLAHIVDSVIWFEGDKNLQFRLLRAVKNRFGPVDEVGIFTMEDKGLVSVESTSSLFLQETKKSVPGSVTTSIMEGTRPVLVEIQALVVSSKMPFPKRVSQGVDPRRIELLLAILQRRANLPLGDYDVFVNVVGGILVKDPAADLAISLSIASSFFDKALPKKVIALGEVDLLGEVRKVRQMDKVAKEARRQGFSEVISAKEFSSLGKVIQSYLR